MPELLVRDGLCISIHTPLAGSDFAFAALNPSAEVFQSTLPLRGATVP